MFKKIFLKIKLKISKIKRIKNFSLFIFLPVIFSTISGSSIFNSIWGLFLIFLRELEQIGTNGFSVLLGGFVSALDIMLQSWGFSLAGYGVWGPLIVVISLGVAGVALFFFFAFIDGEKDVLGLEHDI